MDPDMKPKPGDLIQIFRGKILYQHWAIYVGDGYVIHVVTASEHGHSGTSSVMPGKGGKVTVKKQKLQDVVHNDKYFINNQLDDLYKPRPIEDILKEAEEFVGREFLYNVVTSNCEHFATLLRYGKPQSQQVKQAKKNLFEHGKNSLIVGLNDAGIVFRIIAVASLIKIKKVMDKEEEEEDDL